MGKGILFIILILTIGCKSANQEFHLKETTNETTGRDAWVVFDTSPEMVEGANGAVKLSIAMTHLKSILHTAQKKKTRVGLIGFADSKSIVISNARSIDSVAKRLDTWTKRLKSLHGAEFQPVNAFSLALDHLSHAPNTSGSIIFINAEPPKRNYIDGFKRVIEDRSLEMSQTFPQLTSLYIKDKRDTNQSAKSEFQKSLELGGFKVVERLSTSMLAASADAVNANKALLAASFPEGISSIRNQNAGKEVNWEKLKNEDQVSHAEMEKQLVLLESQFRVLAGVYDFNHLYAVTNTEYEDDWLSQSLTSHYWSGLLFEHDMLGNSLKNSGASLFGTGAMIAYTTLPSGFFVSTGSADDSTLSTSANPIWAVGFPVGASSVFIGAGSFGLDHSVNWSINSFSAGSKEGREFEVEALKRQVLKTRMKVILGKMFPGLSSRELEQKAAGLLDGGNGTVEVRFQTIFGHAQGRSALVSDFSRLQRMRANNYNKVRNSKKVLPSVALRYAHLYPTAIEAYIMGLRRTLMEKALRSSNSRFFKDLKTRGLEDYAKQQEKVQSDALEKFLSDSSMFLRLL